MFFKRANQRLKNAWALKALDRPVFVVGTMRSGTGFLGLKLNEVPTLIGCPFELRRIWHSIGKVSMAWDELGSSCPEFSEQDGSIVPVDKLRSAFVKEVLKNVGDKPWSSELRFLNKNPHLCNKINLVEHLFSSASFIWTIRNLPDVVCSIKNLFEREEMKAKGVKHVWPARSQQNTHRCFNVRRDEYHESSSADNVFPGGDIRYLAEYWLESNLSILHFYTKHGPSKVHIVSQEFLFNTPDQIASRLRTFLNLDITCLTGFGKTIDNSATRQWDSQLTEKQISDLNDFTDQHSIEIEKINTTIANDMGSQ